MIKIKMNRYIPQNLRLLSIIIFLFPAILLSQEKEPEKVLFVGNSFTFFWNMPQMVEAMAADQDVSLKTSLSTASGSNLEQHWKGEKGTNTRQLVEENEWDYVVLQDHSMSTISHKERFKTYSKKWIELIRENNAEPLLAMTWAYDSNPLMQESISSSYLALGKETGVKVVPLGSIFMKAKKARPDLDLYFDDKHPSPEGSYLLALTYYKFFTGNSVMDIPDRLTTIDSEGNQVYLNFILPETGDFLRQLVEEYEMETLNGAGK